MQDKFFTRFDVPIIGYSLPEKFTCFFGNENDNQFDNQTDYQPDKLCLLATTQLQKYLTTQQEWIHNFGLEEGQEGAIIGKMFGVLVVENAQNEIGFLSAFSGKLANSNNHSAFVPPVFDTLAKDSFLSNGMIKLTSINLEIKTLEENKTENKDENNKKIAILKKLRKENSILLQERLFESYHFVNQANKSKNLKEIFRDALNTNPPSGAGECAAPKLLQYAFQSKMRPLAMAEFWWGLSPKSDFWQHKHFYLPCKEKCMPILSYMLSLRCEV